MAMVNCEKCGKTFDKSEKNIRRTKHNFCSRSCSVSYNNKICPKRKIDENMTLRTYYEDGNFRTYKSRVCEHARRVFNKSYPDHKGCVNCGYEKYFEICHIRPVSDFSLDTKLTLVNDVRNLAPLCPTCHWELDNGFLEKEKMIGVMDSHIGNNMK